MEDFLKIRFFGRSMCFLNIRQERFKDTIRKVSKSKVET